MICVIAHSPTPHVERVWRDFCRTALTGALFASTKALPWCYFQGFSRGRTPLVFISPLDTNIGLFIFFLEQWNVLHRSTII